MSAAPIAIASSTGASSAAPSAIPPVTPTRKLPQHPVTVNAPPAAPKTRPPEPACKVVQYFDADGEIRFKKECH